VSVESGDECGKSVAHEGGEEMHDGEGGHGPRIHDQSPVFHAQYLQETAETHGKRLLGDAMVK
jgi:hypothetical protein